ncbi:hypothetical protein [Amycolatopsis sp. NPDC098790]|uniref:hypothetical protein n=1 Tax=Amycolatopsis sp. NPDC098790 TaxID=3363939 RepID=UPI003818066E
MSTDAIDLAAMIRRADEARDAYARTGRWQDADDAVHRWEAIVAIEGAADYHDELGNALMDRHDSGGEASDLRRARTAYETAVDLDRHPALLNNLGNCLRQCHHDLREPDALDAAFEVLTEAAAEMPDADDDLLLCQDNLALTRADRFARSGDAEELRAALALHEQVVAHVGPTNPNLALFLNNLGACAQEMFSQTKDLDVLRRAEWAFACAVDETPPGSPELAMRLANLASARHDLLAAGVPGIDVDALVECAEFAVELSTGTESDWPRRVRVLADVLVERYRLSTAGSDLDRALELYARGAAAAKSAEQAAFANNCAIAHLQRFELSGVSGELDEAVAQSRRALEVAEPGTPAWSLYAGTFMTALITRYEQYGELADLAIVIETAQSALDATPFEGWARVRRLRSLGAAYGFRFDAIGDPADLAHSVEAFELAISGGLETRGEPGVDEIGARHDLSVMLRDRFRHSGDRADIDRAVDGLRDAAAHMAPDAASLPRCLGNLARALEARYRHIGDPQDLADGLSVLGRLLALTAEEAPIRVEYRGDHASLLQGRFEREGTSLDLDQAVALYRQAVSETPATAPARAGLLNSLGNCLWVRYGHLGRLDDLVRAEEAFRSALAQTAATCPDRPIYLDNLATCRIDHYRDERDPALLASALAAYHDALAELPDTAPDCPRIEANHATALWERWALSNRPEDLDAVIDTLHTVLSIAPDTNVARVRWSSNLAVALERRYRLTGAPDDLTAARELHRTACVEGADTDLAWSLQGARNWGRAAMTREQWAEAAEAHGHGRATARRLFLLQHGRQHKEDWLRQATGLAIDAVVTDLRLGRPADAVSALEEGRAQVLSEVLARDALDLDALAAAGREDLVLRYRTSVEALSHLEDRVSRSPHADHIGTS